MRAFTAAHASSVASHCDQVAHFFEDTFSASHLAEKTGLPPDRINDAMSMLVDAGLAEWLQAFGTAPYDFGDAMITGRGRYEYQRAVAAEKAGPASSGQPDAATVAATAIRPPSPVGSPYGFEDEDWEIVAERKGRKDQLRVVFGFQFASEHYNTEELKSNVKASFESALQEYLEREMGPAVSMKFKSLGAGYGGHLFNEIARDIISATTRRRQAFVAPQREQAGWGLEFAIEGVPENSPPLNQLRSVTAGVEPVATPSLSERARSRWLTRSSFELRALFLPLYSWTPGGKPSRLRDGEALATAEVNIVVDVLSFSTCVDIAVSRGAAIYPGERSPDGSIRFAIEDWISAGAVLQGLPGRKSPEAVAAVAAFEQFRDHLREVIAGSVSGRELIEQGSRATWNMQTQEMCLVYVAMLVRK